MPGAGKFYGVGVGPGDPGLLPIASKIAIQSAEILYVPRAVSAETSVAAQCVKELGVSKDKVREIVYKMDPSRDKIFEFYFELASQIALELRKGKAVAYLTIGDCLTYSTYSYLLEILRDLIPELDYTNIAGVTSFAAAAAALDFPLGQGKERVLVLPCPDDMKQLRHEIETHDIVVLMKIGRRLQRVMDLLEEMNISTNCALASRLGLPGQYLCRNLAGARLTPELGYLTTILIRRLAKGVNKS